MKSKRLVLAALFVLGASSAMMAQRGIDDGSKFGHGEDSIRCLQNISLFESYGKSENWADALPAWEIVYSECPASRIRIYTYGAQILKWQLEQEKDPAKKEALIQKLMELYDNRAKYFGNEDKYPTPWILGQKALDYLALTGEKADYKKAYDWLKESVDGMKGASNPQVLHVFMQVADGLYKADQLPKQEYIDDYLIASKYIEEYIPTAKGAMLTYADQVKSAVNSIFANSGAADCETLQNLFAAPIEQNKEDIEYLKQTISLLRKVGCQEIEAYFTASNYAHKIQPTAESAVGLAKQALKKEDMAQAITYFDQATELSDNDNDKAEYQYNVALIYTQQRNYVKARQYALRAADFNKNYGAPYVLIAKLYAGDARNIYPDDPILAQTVFYAAVDKLERARQVDPSVASEAASLISAYRAHFPKQEDIFMHSDLEKGKRITIGGWIQESTTVR